MSQATREVLQIVRILSETLQHCGVAAREIPDLVCGAGSCDEAAHAPRTVDRLLRFIAKLAQAVRYARDVEDQDQGAAHERRERCDQQTLERDLAQMRDRLSRLLDEHGACDLAGD